VGCGWLVCGTVELRYWWKHGNTLHGFHSTNLFVFSIIQSLFFTLPCFFTNSKAPPFTDKSLAAHNFLVRSDEGLVLETSAFEVLYHGQFTFSTQFLRLTGTPAGKASCNLF